MTSILANVTKEQKNAILHGKGPALVSAAPGSGKTMTITKRIAWLIEQGVSPYNILGITFTNKAANEMKHRVKDLVGDAAQYVTLSTFHSFCARLLRRKHGFFELPKNYNIADENDSKTLFIQAVARVEGANESDIKKSDINIGYYRTLVSEAKNKLLLPSDLTAEDEKASLYYREYQNLLGRFLCLDFDDLIMNVALKARNSEKLQRFFAKNIHYLLVDEFQDTNYAQFELIYWMSHIRRNIFVVGDLDQSIYGWRGALSEENEQRFLENFEEATIYLLQTNFRSVPPIVEAANLVIKNNPKRIEKTSVAYRKGGSKPTVVAVSDPKTEAKYVISDIIASVRRGADWKDHAILYRTNKQSRVLEEVCISKNVPYKIIGAIGFFNKAVVKDILSYARLILTPQHDISFVRIYNKPTRGIGKTSFNVLNNFAANKDIPLVKCLEHIEDIKDKLSSSATAGLEKLKNNFDKWSNLNLNEAGSVIEAIVNDVRYVDFIDTTDAKKTAQKIEDVENLIQAAYDYDRDEKGGLLGFLEYVDLMQSLSDKKDDNPNTVFMMSIHAAKGLEFPNVYIVGAESSTMPIIIDIDEATNPEEFNKKYEEERRVFFVGITRAENKLTITYPKFKLVGRGLVSTTPSPFLMEMKTAVNWRL